jgi:hypothetical protein
MDNLFWGNLFPPLPSGGGRRRRFVQRRFVKACSDNHSGHADQHSGVGSKVIGMSPES